MFKLFITIVIALIITSCTSQKRIISEAKEQGILLRETNSVSLSGQYSLISDSRNEGLIYFLSEEYNVDLSKIDSNLQIKCDFEHDTLNRYRLMYHIQDTILSSDTLFLEINIKRYVFKLKTRYTFKIFGIINGFGSVKRFIGIDQYGNLVAFRENSGIGFFLIAPAFAAGQTKTSIFERK